MLNSYNKIRGIATTNCVKTSGGVVIAANINIKI